MEATGKKEREKFDKSYFEVMGLCCTSEVPLIEKILNSLDGIKDFTVVVPTKTLIVVHDSLLVSQLQIVKALNQARLEANIRVYGDTTYKNKWPSPYAVACGTLLLLSFLKYVYSPVRWLALVSIAVGIPPVLLKAVTAARNLRLDINILVLITVAGSIALRDYWEAGTIVFLFTISEWLESRASHKATAVMSSLVSVVPQKATIAETGEEINADEVKLNTILAVKAGEVIPIDGVVVEGDCEVDEKNLTGESFPVTKQKDSIVWASTINLNSYISIKTTTVAEDCVVARMAKIVEEAQNKKSETQRFLDKCAKYYTPAIVVISASLAIVPLAFHIHNKKQWYHLALVILVSGCPCALLLSTPVAMFCALSKAATLGVLLKGGQHLETLAGIKIMAFDKTGTITRGEFMVVDFKSFKDEINMSTLLYWISSIECKSSHPMAAALVDYARTSAIEPKPDIVENFQNFPGEGISGKINDHELYIGNSKIASRAGCTAVPKLEGYDTEGMSVGYIFVGSSPAGIFCLTDVCRTGAKEAIQELKSIGIKTVMLTGDCHGAAKRAQEQLGGALEVICAELLPEDKAQVIKELQREGPTAMIGDGLNDAPALATADIGISMGVSGSALATESGDIVLMSNDIRRIAKAFRIAKKVRRKIIENVILSLSTKAAIIGLGIAGHPLVWAAVLADVGTCLIVIFNSMLLLRGTPKRGKKCCQDQKSKCEVQSCSSNSCENDKCSGSAQDQSHSAHSDSTVKDSRCCGKVKKNLESQKRGCSGSSPGSCGKMKCSNPTKDQAHSAHHHSHTAEDHQSCRKVEKDLESQKHSGSSSGSCGNKKCSNPPKDQAHSAHHHSHTVKDHQTCRKVEEDPEPTRSHSHGCSENRKCKEKNAHENSLHEHYCCTTEEAPEHETKRSEHHSHGTSCTAENVESSFEHCEEAGHSGGTLGCKSTSAECSAVCTATKMKHRGCCESYRRECCVRKGHFGTNLQGCLSEIVID